jgi:hypothetical protein
MRALDVLAHLPLYFPVGFGQPLSARHPPAGRSRRRRRPRGRSPGGGRRGWRGAACHAGTAVGSCRSTLAALAQARRPPATRLTAGSSSGFASDGTTLYQWRRSSLSPHRLITPRSGHVVQPGWCCQELGRWALTISAPPAVSPAMTGSWHWTARAGSSCEVPPAAQTPWQHARSTSHQCRAHAAGRYSVLVGGCARGERARNEVIGRLLVASAGCSRAPVSIGGLRGEHEADTRPPPSDGKPPLASQTRLRWQRRFSGDASRDPLRTITPSE